MRFVFVRRFISRATIFIAFLFAALPAFAVVSGVTYQGRILKPDGSPLEGSNVQFRMQIRSPGGENCLLYEEQQNLDMRNTKGLFSLTLNDGTGARLDSSGLTIDRIFANRGALSFAGGACSVGTAYTPNEADGRKLIVQFKDETMSSWEPMPVTNINFVPFALESRQIQGFGSNSLVRVQEADGTMGNISPLSNASYTELLALIAGSSTQYVRNGTSAGARVPTYTGNPASPVAGSIWFDTTSNQLKFRDGTSVQTVGTSGGSVSSVTAGSGLATTPAGGITSTGSIAIAVGGVVSTMLADGSVITAKIADSSVTSAKIVDATIATADLADSSVTSAKINDGTIVGGDLASNIVISTTGGITASGFTTSGTVTASTVSAGVNITRQIQLFDPDAGSTNKVTFTADNTLSGDYTLTWPLDDGSANQVLMTDGSGKLSWTTITPGTGDFKADGSVPMTGNLRLGGQWLSNDGGAEGIRVDNSGNVGIGTASPSFPLDVNGSTIRVSSANDTGIVFAKTGGKAGILAAGANGAGFNFDSTSKFAIGSSTRANIDAGTYSGTDIVTVLGSGNVGIGTVTPQEKLDVNGAIRVGTTTSCGAPNPGTIRYNSGNLEYCNGTAWQILGVAGAGITALTGDVTASGTGSVAATIANDAVTSAKIADGTVATADVADKAITFAKVQDIATSKLIGRSTASTGPMEELSVGTGLSLSGGTLSSTLTGLPSCASGELAIYITSSWTCVGATSANTASTVVRRDSSGNFVSGTATLTSSLILKDGAAGGQISFATPVGFTNYSLTLPVDDGTPGQLLSTNGSGVLSWAAAGGMPSNSIPIYQVRAATTANITLSGTQTIDGVAVVAGDRVLVKNQTIDFENGVYVVASGAWTRATDMDAWSETIGYGVRVSEGDAWAGMTYTSSTTAGGTLGVNSIVWNAAGSGNPSNRLVATGNQALLNNTTGYYNTATGFEALRSNTTGYLNTAYGNDALRTNSGGYFNTASGSSALRSNTTGYANTATGSNALYANQTGNNNTADGSGALTNNSSGNANTAVGSTALTSNTNGHYNAAYGADALRNSTSGYYNVASGYQSLLGNTTGDNNTAIGAGALSSNKGKRESTAVGYNSMYYADSTNTNTITYNTAIGAYSLQGSTTAASNFGLRNTALGHSALKGMSSGSDNIGIGYNAGSAITTGSGNVVIGSNTGSTIATSSNNILIADGAGTERIRVDSSGNVGIGTSSPSSTFEVQGGTATAGNGKNITLVAQSGFTTGNTNGGNITLTAGAANGTGLPGKVNVGSTGINFAPGSSAGSNPQAGFNGIYSSGTDRLDFATAGVNRFSVLSNGFVVMGSGSTKVIGNYFVDYGTNSNGLNMDGNGVYLHTANTDRLTINNAGSVGIGTYTPSEKLEVVGNVKATSFITTSDARLKEDIARVPGLEAILKLKGVHWAWKDSHKPDMGVLAQDVEKVFPDAVVTDSKTGFKAVKYQSLIAPLIESTKELYGMCRANEDRIAQQENHTRAHDRRIASLETENRVLKSDNEKLKDEVEQLKHRMEQIEKLLSKAK